MSELRWQLDGLTLEILLERLGRDRFPYPLSFRPARMEHRDDYERLVRRTEQRLAQVFDKRLYRAMEVLLEPQVRVEIHGFHGPQQDRVVRVHAGLVDQVATIAVQQPGPTVEHGTDVVITMGYANMAVSTIASHLPRVRGGSHQPFGARRSDLNQPVYSQHPTRLSPTEQLARFIRRPRIGTGEITVYPGAAFDARPTNDGHAFLWMDYPNDGRYLLTNHNDNDFTVTPGPIDELMRHLQLRIDHVHRLRTGAW
ncbi:ESX secretion-associated protein EspG [Nocardia puris]|uniref:ESAT-6 protein secretion system EspG family protein n=1 Tax=Nocardia puris TaxID=208602 RepID=A0A366DQQ1_9NOCA|nr:ESX secretion-associated protein EspG [Nocardia puris]MBF6211084.1 ESX secretion-associated protein EspG [Nocardia puris]RBO92410.1 ESAT-6 protein secretion system EspG family protein [Nocardia puris]